MKVLHKNVTLGEYKFGISIDRDITAEVFEQYPDLLTFLLNYADEGAEPNEIIKKAIAENDLKMVLGMNDSISECTKYAFPLMLAKADKTDFTENCNKADEIFAYAKENDADELFATELFKFLCLGFTIETSEQKKPKIKVAIK